MMRTCQILMAKVASITASLWIVLALTREGILCMHARTPEAIDAAMLRDYFIPDILDFNSPNDSIWIRYGKREVNFGLGLFSPDEVKDMPTYFNYPCSKDVYYTMTFTGLDMPTRKHHDEREYRHWHIVNIPENQINQGDTLAEYIGPMYTNEDGLHRFIFFIFAQPNKTKMNFDEKKLTKTVHGKERVNFHTMEFAEKYGLKEPLCVNYFLMDRMAPTEPPTPPMI
nr:PREDICTED: protein D3-like isoform X1 [Bemisia tabaci]XP_018915331.1 PREDICTED: protein D3-like isoform X1 [Bemisia tabaci]XP_018915332.1 PREDICTED: protein D3-like isoform X1 [Bemisia tabaci]